MNPEETIYIMWRRHPLRVLICLAMLFAAGCGGDAGNYQAGGGIGGTGVAIGSVSGHGSIVVNGVRFDTAGAGIYLEGGLVGTGDQAARDLLPIGQEVVVRGDVADDVSGSATRVDAFNRVRGPLDVFEPYDALNARLVIMGQTVYVGPQTRWEEISMEETALQMVLEVSGPVDDTGVVHAGRVRWVAPYLLGDDRVMVKGPVQDLNTLQRTFWINDLEIDYSRVQEPMAWMDNSHTVSVQGRLAADILIADAVDAFVTASFDAATDFILEGFVQASDGPYPWSVGEYDLRFDGQPEIDIAAGIRILARGTLQDRVLWVDAVRAATAVRLESNVASVDADTGVLTLDGMAPLAVRVPPLTRIIAVGPPGTAEIQVGHHLSIYAHTIDDRSAAAATILVIPGLGVRDKFHLEGPVTSIGTFQFDILGVAVDTEASADIRFYDTDEEALTVGEFMAALHEGTLVRVTGRWDGDRVAYETMSIVR
jgi:hypothetical protein